MDELQDLSIQSNFIDYALTNKDAWHLYYYAHNGYYSSSIVKFNIKTRQYKSIAKKEDNIITAISANKEKIYLYSPQKGFLVANDDSSFSTIYDNWPQNFPIEDFINVSPDVWLILPSRGSNLIYLNGKTGEVSEITIAESI